MTKRKNTQIENVNVNVAIDAIEENAVLEAIASETVDAETVDADAESVTESEEHTVRTESADERATRLNAQRSVYSDQLMIAKNAKERTAISAAQYDNLALCFATCSLDTIETLSIERARFDTLAAKICDKLRFAITFIEKRSKLEANTRAFLQNAAHLNANNVAFTRTLAKASLSHDIKDVNEALRSQRKTQVASTSASQTSQQTQMFKHLNALRFNHDTQALELDFSNAFVVKMFERMTESNNA